MKGFKTLLISTALFAAVPVMAHDEGHGPKLSDAGKFGGLVSAIVEKKDAGLGPKAKLYYKAELLRLPEGKVQVYVYDPEMKPIESVTWEKKAKAMIFAHKKGSKAKSFDLTYDGKAFVGQMPDGMTKPFNLDLVFTDKGRELLSAFDNLD